MDAVELGELLARLARIEAVEVREEDSLHEALEQVAMRRCDLLLLDPRRSPAPALTRLANAAGRACGRGTAPRVVAADGPLARMHSEVDGWIDAHQCAARKGPGTTTGHWADGVWDRPKGARSFVE